MGELQQLAKLIVLPKRPARQEAVHVDWPTQEIGQQPEGAAETASD